MFDVVRLFAAADDAAATAAARNRWPISAI